jgi:hypothetical protein
MSLAASKRANELETALNAWEDNRLLTSGVVKLKQVCGIALHLWLSRCYKNVCFFFIPGTQEGGAGSTSQADSSTHELHLRGSQGMLLVKRHPSNTVEYDQQKPSLKSKPSTTQLLSRHQASPGCFDHIASATVLRVLWWTLTERFYAVVCRSIWISMTTMKTWCSTMYVTSNSNCNM